MIPTFAFYAPIFRDNAAYGYCIRPAVLKLIGQKNLFGKQSI